MLTPVYYGAVMSDTTKLFLIISGAAVVGYYWFGLGKVKAIMDRLPDVSGSKMPPPQIREGVETLFSTWEYVKALRNNGQQYRGL